MTEAVQAILPTLLALSEEERSTLIRELSGSFDESSHEAISQEEWECAWEAEFETRAAKRDRGDTKGRPAAEVIRELREKL